MSGIVTYSPAYTLVPTYECFNRCTYCNFRTEPGMSPWLELAEAERVLKSLQGRGVIEILILSGEVHPESKLRSLWFERIYNLCELALSLGFLPHTNVGPLSLAEMAKLKEVNVSMGLMLEQLTPELMKTVHRYAPSKVPELRLQHLEWAGELRIPFTTGLLLGIGETAADWQESLQALARLHQRWGHLQEVILQPYSPAAKNQSETGFLKKTGFLKLKDVVALARDILPPDITLQIPPNLIQQPAALLACLQAGARDLGGIGPIDEVNPDYPHPHLQQLTAFLKSAGWQLVPRLPVYPQYDKWLNLRLQAAVTCWRSAINNSAFAVKITNKSCPTNSLP
ncbi:MAG: 7,8-didemethyl-8-hydroxy-5-deazariboflavin synthase subunit CofG [Oscillatoriaceae bacterium SKW80]|nr:7,8-didemethyl-8-hydroxy-5-deazariboflavin synthase subunit CofG [Oscillatoriaceae bacterium SKYG93]MCX8121446.1 7,8-didemethyl-8-hydroxy-5-deazariboflavin synthase subunit CofG [Oscillatoriaceae bacterium SKW80]MDW8455146.1 7,8-didemethyl-8-hydroxy-5-deazariboflavin synthase subunit CofG [Oscillatoriaceae cyanobacterium SKYGB_i_bin93]HIK26455.1 7,8-didemethyl-8-hydroxy-5-deazariboflavin synthase subunit CofG [Oscillatoriaceae cyanobacterium M7585_C2015_266]